jgi:tetratricopeptide (TPR) repeat protein
MQTMVNPSPEAGRVDDATPEVPVPARRRRLRRPLSVAGLAVLLFVIGGIGLFGSLRTGAPAVSSRTGAAFGDKPVVASGTLSQAISSLQDRLRAFPNDWQSWATLGLAYVQQARVTADPSYYPKAEGALNRSLAIRPTGNFQALTGLGALASARHDFSGALAFGERAEKINPDNSNVHGVVGDSLIELGRYPAAFVELQKMVDLRPGLSSYARVSYARELQGDTAGAVELMTRAFDDATTPEDRAWVSNQLGDLGFNSGDLAGAERNYERARAMDPTFVPAQAGLAKVLAARGRTDRAIAGYQDVVRVFPLPEYVIALIDLQTVAGRTADAGRQIGLLHVEERLFQANGVNMDLEIALFDADHNVDVAGGLAAAQREWARRKSVVVADALAWSLYANGRFDEALSFSHQALNLGTQQALFFFHRGMIEKALGRTALARKDIGKAVDINPHFSILWSERAAGILASLKG